MPQQPTNEDPLQWIAIDDFTPGCYSNGGVVVGNTVDRMLSAPPGAADAENTWACYALPSKALAALPGVTQTYTWPDTTSTGYNHTAAAPTYVVGLLVHDELASGNTEAILIGEFDTGSNHYWQAYSDVLETSSLNSIVNTVEATGAGIFGSPYIQATRVANAFIVSGVSVGATTVFTISTVSATNPFAVGNVFYLDQLPVGVTGLMLNTPYTVTAIGGSSGAWTISIGTPTTGGSWSAGGLMTILQIPYGPVFVFPSGGPANVSAGQLYMYPNPATPTSYAALPMMANPGGSVSGQTIAHQSRIFVLAGSNYPYPPANFTTNESLNYTDPPLTASMGNQQTVLAAEQPYGYGGAGSISAGELFLVKKRGGGILLSGDINTSAQVTVLPGVQPTGNFYGNAASTPMGLLYCSEDNGAWVWNGSNTSQKVSQNLDDAFFLPPEFNGGMASNNYGYYVSSFGDKMYFSNNWLFDTRGGGWWTYYPRKSAGTVGGVQGEDLFWVQPVNGNYIYCAQLSFIGATSLNFMYRFDPATAAQYYQWRSLPFRVTDRDHRTDIREVVIRASCSASNGTITVSVYDQDVFETSQTMPSPVGTGPQIIRFNMPGGGYSEPQIQVAVANSSPGDMPIIHSIEIGYRERAHQAVQN